MKVDLNSGVYIEIGGELGRYNSLPVDVLAKIAKDFQNLIISIAKHTLSSDEFIDLNNFQLELTGFEKASAVPKFSYSSRAESKSGFLWESQRNLVNDNFNNVLQIANKGDYYELKKSCLTLKLEPQLLRIYIHLQVILKIHRSVLLITIEKQRKSHLYIK